MNKYVVYYNNKLTKKENIRLNLIAKNKRAARRMFYNILNKEIYKILRVEDYVELEFYTKDTVKHLRTSNKEAEKLKNNWS